MSGRAVVAMPTRAGTRMLEGNQPEAGFDVDAFHVMDSRDNALIQDEVLHGSMSRKFVYSFKIKDTVVSGISVIGARQLAFHYRGLQHRIVASQEKTGRIFKFTSYPQPGMPMSVQASVLPELEEEPDFYSSIVEVKDIKTGNAVQMESSETRMESRRDGSLYERPHYAKIAQAKAYRNAVLALIPQDVQLQWKAQMLELGESVNITEDVIAEKRAAVLRYAAQHAIPISRPALQAIGFDQIGGLADAARAGLPAFRASLGALGMADGGEPPPPSGHAAAAPPARPAPSGQRSASGQASGRPPAGETTGTGGPPPGHPAADATQSQPEGGTSSPATGTPPQTQPSGQTAAAPWQASVVDASGVVVSTHQDPVQWAMAFTGYRDDAFPPDMDAIDHANQATILDAAQASPEAADMLSAWLPPPPPPLDEPIPLSSNVAVYGRAIQDAIGRLTADTVLPFVAANGPNWRTLARSRQLELERMISAKCQALKVHTPRLFDDGSPP